MPSIEADHRQVQLPQLVPVPGLQGTALQTDAHGLGCPLCAGSRRSPPGWRWDLPSQITLPSLSTTQTEVCSCETSSPTHCSMPALLSGSDGIRPGVAAGGHRPRNNAMSTWRKSALSSGPSVRGAKHDRRAEDFPDPSCRATDRTSISRPLKLTMPPAFLGELLELLCREFHRDLLPRPGMAGPKFGAEPKASAARPIGTPLNGDNIPTGGTRHGLARRAGGAGDGRRLGHRPRRGRAVYRGRRAGRRHGARRDPGRRNAARVRRRGRSGSPAMSPASPTTSAPSRKPCAPSAGSTCSSAMPASSTSTRSSPRFDEEKLGRGLRRTVRRSTSRDASSAPRRRCRSCARPTAAWSSPPRWPGSNSGGGGALYTASKHAVVGLIRQLAVELGPAHPGQRRRAGRHDDRSARAGDARQGRPLAIRRSRQSPTGCAPTIRCRSRSSPPISPAPTCFSRRATMPAASPARIVTVDAGATLRMPRPRR